MKTFSIVVPVYNNGANLPGTIPALLALQAELPGYDLELVLVDDGSRDGSRALILDFASRQPDRICAVLLTRNFGQNAAIQAGLRYAKGDCVGVISCDLQEPHEQFVPMVRAWEQGAKFVIGERVERAENWLHRTISGCYWYLLRRFAFADYPPMGFDFCLLDRQVVDDVNQINEKKLLHLHAHLLAGLCPASDSRSPRAAHERKIAMACLEKNPVHDRYSDRFYLPTRAAHHVCRPLEFAAVPRLSRGGGGANHLPA
jgi:glycosyltransferase involved in cell wall biosynthesis